MHISRKSLSVARSMVPANPCPQRHRCVQCRAISTAGLLPDANGILQADLFKGTNALTRLGATPLFSFGL
ncbi:hypothetical protein BCAR13_80106 [Paraburkholderia caribensis]|nr:hypothetical protein BCAR13_80106 [Paraburkholderia caribensis]